VFLTLSIISFLQILATSVHGQTTVTGIPAMGSDDTTTTSMAPVVLVDDAHVGLIQFICQKMKTYTHVIL